MGCCPSRSPSFLLCATEVVTVPTTLGFHELELREIMCTKHLVGARLYRKGSVIDLCNDIANYYDNCNY